MKKRFLQLLPHLLSGQAAMPVNAFRQLLQEATFVSLCLQERGIHQRLQSINLSMQDIKSGFIS